MKSCGGTGSGTAVVNQPFVYDLVDKQKRKYVFVIALDTYGPTGWKRSETVWS